MTRGRPKSFNDNEALERAMNLFWRYGYDATSLDALVGAMEIPRQSLYRTFGDKRGLFIRAIELYATRMNQSVTQVLLADGLAIDNINKVFQLWHERLTSTDKQGCMMQNTYSQSILADEDVSALVMTHQKRIPQALEKALKIGQQQGNINKSIDARAVSRTITSSINGLFALSRTNLPSEFTKDVINTFRSLIQVN
jgi:TetR/AcrR family transcriptional repressor of nem operon